MMSEPKLSRPLTEKEQRVFNAAKYGSPPEQPKLVQLEPKRAGVFSLEDLAAAGSRCEWVPMPGGNGVWVHPLSPSETIWVQRHVLREVGAMQNLTGAEAEVEVDIRTLVWQAIAVCRTGESPLDARVFQEKDAETLRTHPALLGALRLVQRTSDRLGEVEEPVRKALARFFGDVADWLAGWSSQLTADTVERSRETLRDFASSLSAMKQLDRPTPEMMRQVTAMMEEADGSRS